VRWEGFAYVVDSVGDWGCEWKSFNAEIAEARRIEGLGLLKQLIWVAMGQ
jgi:hypothetical protein